MNDIEKAIENMKSHVNAYENNLRSINTVNSINNDWDGISALGQPISINDKRYEYTVESLESCKLSIKALEKQIPQKPIKQSKSCGIAIGDCPCCGNYVDGMKNPFYCTNKDCLQKLDWEE